MNNTRVYFKWGKNGSSIDYAFDFNNDVTFDCSHVQFIDTYSISIPKNLVFIWIGEHIPEYTKFSIQKFKQVNPDFNVYVKHVVDWETTKDKHVQYVKDRIGYRNGFFGKYWNCQSSERLRGGNNVDLNVVRSDMLRFSVLNDIGGIYLDGDTFPNKPFDDSLLKKNFFVGYETLEHDKWEDIFFLGMKPNTISDDDYISDEYGNFGIYQIFKSPYFNYNKIDTFNVYMHPQAKQLKEQFFSTTLNYRMGQFGTDSYIVHFCKRNWNTNLLDFDIKRKLTNF